MAERREVVRLELVDNFSTEMARAAAATALLNRELSSLSGKSVETSRDSDRLQRSLSAAGSEVANAGNAFESGGRSIDRYSGRLGLLVDTALTLGPALIPIGAAAIPALAGLTAGLGAAAGAFGVTLLAVQGLGDGLKALDAYQLEPTAENLAALKLEMDKLGPAGAEFVRYLDDLEPQLHALQDVARQGLFPGVEEGIDALLTKLPQAKRIIFDLATALGDVSASAGKGLAGSGFAAFFDYLETDAAPTLKAFAEATGNVATGIANLIVGVAPLTRDFTSGMVEATQSFENWTASLAGTEGFQEFLSYVRDTGPMVADLVGQLAMSLAAVAEAAAPVGQALLPALTAIAKTVEIIAKSDLGTPLFAGIAAMSALRLATQAWGKIAQTSIAGFVAGNARAAGSILTVVSAQERAMMSSRELAAAQSAQTRSAIAGAGKMAAVFAGLALASGEFGDSVATSNASTMALMGSFMGPAGTAAGAAIGFFLDLKENSAQASAAIDALHEAMLTGDEKQFTASLAAVNDQLERQTQDTIYGTSFLGEHIGSLVNAVVPLTNYKKLLGGVTGSTDDLEEASNSAAHGVSFFGEQLGIAAKKSEAAAKHTERVQSALIASRDAAQETADAFLAFGDSLDDNKVSLDDWIAEQQKMADALQNFAKNAADAARKGLDEGLIQKLKEAGPEGALRMKQLADGSIEQINRLNKSFHSGEQGARSLNDVLRSLKSPVLDVQDAQMRAKVRAAINALRAYGLTKAQASLLIQDLASGKIKSVQQLINKYGLTKAEATALLNDLASGKIRGIQALLNSLHDKTVTINTIHQDSYVSKLGGTADPNPDARGADGMTVPGTRHPYGDKVLAYIAPGEEVISNRDGQADRNRDLLKAINANRFADGGTAGLGAGGTPRFAGLSPSSQLFGINHAALSIAELAKRLESLTANQIRHLSDDLDKLSKNDLTKLSKALGDVVESEKADLQELKQARSSLVQSVRDLVTGGDLFTVADNNGQVTASGGSQDYLDLVAQHNAMLASQPGSGVTSNLDSMLDAGRERLRLIREIKHLGVDGPALAYLATQPIEVLRELAGSKRQANQFENQYNQLQQLGQQVGSFVGNAAYGKQIATQTAELQASRKELQQVNKELKAIHKALEHQRHENKKNSHDNAQTVARSISGATGTAARSRR